MQSQWIRATSHPFWRVRFDHGELNRVLAAVGTNFGGLAQIIRSYKCVVGFDEPIPRGWIRIGLSTYLLSHILTKSAKLQQYSGTVYSFQMHAPPGRVSVREHYYLSEPYFMTYFAQRYRQDGRKYWQAFINNPYDAARPENRGIAECIALYLNSTVHLQHYLSSGQKYVAAEMWYEGDYRCEPFSGIRRLSNNAVEILQGKR